MAVIHAGSVGVELLLVPPWRGQWSQCPNALLYTQPVTADGLRALISVSVTPHRSPRGRARRAAYGRHVISDLLPPGTGTDAVNA